MTSKSATLEPSAAILKRDAFKSLDMKAYKMYPKGRAMPYPKWNDSYPAGKVMKMASSSDKAAAPKRAPHRNGIKSKPTAYNKFIKEHYKAMAAKNPEMKTAELRKVLSEMWKVDPNNPRSDAFIGIKTGK